MKTIGWICVLGLAGAPVAKSLRNQDPAPKSPSSAEEQTVLAGHMERVEACLKKLRRTLRDESRAAESLALAVELEEATLACKQEIPRKAAGVAEAERAAFVLAYRKEMLRVLQEELALEAALLDGNAAAALEHYQRIADSEDPGHEKFTDE
jgi:hypothetical protein